MPQFQMPPQVQQFADGLDHSQGKWFAPGEVLPAGFAPALHPEGHTEPQAHHQMSDIASQSFVMTGADMQKAAATATRDLPASTAKKSSKKKSKKKKSSGCC